MERIVVVLVGPTCSGKTSVGISLAKNLESEIISADSRQIYKRLSIGTAKPNADELAVVKHHFIDMIEPDVEYNVSRFETEALSEIDRIISSGKIPVVVGGSGLYIRALIDGLFNNVDTDDDFREELKIKREKFGNEFIYEELKKVDLVSAERMLPQNWKRVMRALEVYHITGAPISKFQQEYQRETPHNFIQFGLEWEREILYRNIEKRVDEMVGNGLVEEVKNILSAGFSNQLNALNTVGYKEIISFLNNEITLERAIELIKRNTRRYAKRQMTWFRKDERINWIHVDSGNDFKKISGQIFENVKKLNPGAEF
jgi:tRNA dimethylallyltransferase